MSRRGADMPAEPAEQAALEGLQKRFKELQDQAAQYVAGNEVASSISAMAASVSMPRPERT